MRVLALLALSGCGRIGFDAQPHDAELIDGTPAHCLTETFDAFDPQRWFVSFGPNSVNVMVVNQRLELTPTPFVLEYNGLSSQSKHDITRTALEVELVQATDQADFTETTMELEYAPALRYFFVASAGQFHAIERAATDNIRQRLVTVAQVRYWRFIHDEDNNLVRWLTSADKTTWTEEHAVTAPASPLLVRIYLYAGQYGAGTATPGTGIFDNFRLAYDDCP